MESSHVVDGLARVRLLVLVPAAVSPFLWPALPADGTAFATLGDRLLHGQLSSVYDSAQNQAGPIQLLLNWLLLLGGHDGRPQPALVSAVNVALLAAAMRMSRRVGPARLQARRQLVVGVLGMLCLTQIDMWAGHPAEAAIPLLWLAGLRYAAIGRGLRGALLFGLSVGVAPWAVLALPAFLAFAPVRRAVFLALGATAVGAGLYLPFVLSGHFMLFAHIWPVTSTTLLGHLAPSLTTFDWRLRLAQAAVVAGGTAWAALGVRRRPQLAIALVPLTTVLLRILTDPLQLDYYWTAVGVLAVAALAASPQRRNVLSTDVRLIALVYFSFAAVASHLQIAGDISSLVLIASLITGRGRQVYLTILSRLPQPPGRQPAS